jgi:hypothetical protein
VIDKNDYDYDEKFLFEENSIMLFVHQIYLVTNVFMLHNVAVMRITHSIMEIYLYLSPVFHLCKVLSREKERKGIDRSDDCGQNYALYIPHPHSTLSFDFNICFWITKIIISF